MSYRITITDPLDLFFHFTSVDITPELFHVMTESIKMDLPTQPSSRKGTCISRSTATFRHATESAGEDLGAAMKQWFHDSNGARGVVGVISGDFMNGVITNPERYL